MIGIKLHLGLDGKPGKSGKWYVCSQLLCLLPEDITLWTKNKIKEIIIKGWRVQRVCNARTCKRASNSYWLGKNYARFFCNLSHCSYMRTCAMEIVVVQLKVFPHVKIWTNRTRFGSFEDVVDDSVLEHVVLIFFARTWYTVTLNWE